MNDRTGTVRICDLGDPLLPEAVVGLQESMRGSATALVFRLDVLEEVAAGEAGLDDFGDDIYREPYTVLLHALDDEA